MEEGIVKLAIAAEGPIVSQHFGHCTEYVMVTIENGTVVAKETVESPGHSPGALPPFLAGLGATKVLAGGMGPKAVELFNEQGIDVYLGVSGTIEETIESFVNGTLVCGISSCTH